MPAKKRTPKPPTTFHEAMAQARESAAALAMLQKAHDRLQKAHDRLVEELLDMARTKMTRVRGPSGERAMTDEEIVRAGELKTAAKVREKIGELAARQKQKADEEDEHFIESAAKELMRGGASRADALKEARRLRREAKGLSAEPEA